MSDEQRRALAGSTPTTEVIRDAVTFPRDRLGEPLDISPERFDAWLAAEVRAASEKAWDDCVDEAEGSGWIHDYAVREMYARNPHRATETGGRA